MHDRDGRDVPGRIGRDRTTRGSKPMLRRLILASLFTLSTGTAMADDRKVDPDAVEFFESKVRPVLVEHCYKCHSAQAKAPKGGLRLDSLDGMKKGGDTGPAIVPGDADASLLVQAVRYKDEQTKMPPKGKLTEATIATLEQWVRGGAVMPHGVEAAAVEVPRPERPPASTSKPRDPTGPISRSASRRYPP